MAWKAAPGETPIDDLSELKIKGLTRRREVNALEAENVRKVVIKYLASRPSRRSAPFTLTWAKKLHKQMFGEVWKWAGRLRCHDLNIGLPWHQVETSLQQLLLDLRYWEQQGVDWLEQAVMLHHRAVSIHPFINGNGRWARMLANIWLKLHGLQPTDWPEETIGAESAIRRDYLRAVRAADAGDYEPLIKLHRRYTPAD